MEITLEPTVLRWVRTRAELTVEDLAVKLKMPIESVLAWEQTGELEYSQAKKLAAKTHAPFGYLFLPEPLDESLPIRDFRTIGLQHEVSKPSLNLLETIYDAQEIQMWFRDYIRASGGPPLPFVGSIKITDDHIEIAERIRFVIQFGSIRKDTVENSLRDYITAVRKNHIIVIRNAFVRFNNNRRLSVSEFRGFCLSDEYAPLIFINGNDAKSAQIFTLMHELVHVWLGETGVSNLTRTYAPAIDVELFCNAVAAEILVPLNSLRTLWYRTDDPFEDIRRTARHYSVSNLVIARRLFDAGYLAEEDFHVLYSELEFLGQSFINKSKNERNRGGFFINAYSRYGEYVLRTIIGDVFNGRTPYRDAMRLLGVARPSSIDTIAKGLGMAI